MLPLRLMPPLGFFLLTSAMASAADFSTPFSFESTVGVGNLTTLDFDTPVAAATTAVVDGVTFATSGSDVVWSAGAGVLENGELDRNLEITFPDPVTAFSIQMTFLDLFNDPTLGGVVRGEEVDGVEVFSAAQSAGGFFYGRFDPNQPIKTLHLEPASGGRSVIDTLQYATVPEPAAWLGMLCAMAAGWLGLQRITMTESAR